jgi:hypothetical protein
LNDTSPAFFDVQLPTPMLTYIMTVDKYQSFKRVFKFSEQKSKSSKMITRI